MAQKARVTNTSTPVKPILSSDEAADLLSVGAGTLANWRSRGVGPAYCKLGHRVVYLLDDVMAYLAAHRVATSDEADDAHRVVPRG